MIRVLTRSSLLGQGELRVQEIEAGAQTPATIALAVLEHRPEWRGLPLSIAVNGAEIDESLLGAVLEDGSEIGIAPSIGGAEIALGTIIVQALVTAAVSVVVGLAVQALTPKPDPPGAEQERGDESSPVYAWDGIQTSYGTGFPIPIVFGRHDVGGQVIYTSVFASSAGGSQREFLRVILAFSEGPVHAIGGEQRDRDNLGGFAQGSINGQIPDNIRVNGTLLDSGAAVPNVRVSTRMGSLDQEPLAPPFSGARATDSINESLDNDGSAFVYTVQEVGELAVVNFVFAAPRGIYDQDQSGNIQPVSSGDAPPNDTGVKLSLQWRVAGTATWRAFQNPDTSGLLGTQYLGQIDQQTPFVRTVRASLPPATKGPIEVRVRRLSPQGGRYAVDSIIWRQITWGVRHAFSYPRIALAGFDLLTSERVSGGLPQFVNRIDGILVRVWSSDRGFSPYCWDAAPAPWVSYRHEPGRNPAWVAVELLLAKWGLGRYLTQANLDLQSFHEWAVYCDAQPGPIGDVFNEARHTFDYVLDQPTSAWELFLRVLQAGRAAPVKRGEKLGVTYRYRDAHADGNTVSVPARERTQVFTSANVREMQLELLDSTERATVFRARFLNEDLEYSQDSMTVPDPESTLSQPLAVFRDKTRVESQQMFGLTRPTQVFRALWAEHRLQRRMKRRISFVVPFQALAVEPGDVVGVQSDVLRPYVSDTSGLTIEVGGEATSAVQLDRAVTLQPGATYELVFQGSDGVPGTVVISSPAGTYARGENLDLASPISCISGTPAAIGQQDQVVDDYEVTAITLAQNLERKVTAVTWDPTAYDEPTPADFDSVVGGAALAATVNELGAGLPPGDESGLFALSDFVDPQDVRLEAVGDGTHSVMFARPAGRAESVASVHARVPGKVDWTIVRTVGDQASLTGLPILGSVEVAVMLPGEQGGTRLPPDEAVGSHLVEEFPSRVPLDVVGAVLSLDPGTGMPRIDWPDVDLPRGTVVEVRRGTQWDSGLTVARTRGAGCVDLAAPGWLPAGITYWVAARDLSGQYSLEPQIVLDPEFVAGGWDVAPHRALGLDEVGPGALGTTSGLTYLASHPSLDCYASLGGFYVDEGAVEGSYTSIEHVLRDGSGAEYQGRAYWAAEPVVHLNDTLGIDEIDIEVDSGEAYHRTVDYRPASFARPGVGDVLLDTFNNPLDLLPANLGASGWDGSVGRPLLALVESRFFANGFWGGWSRHQNGWREASKMQVRVTLVPDAQIEAALIGLHVSIHV